VQGTSSGTAHWPGGLSSARRAPRQCLPTALNTLSGLRRCGRSDHVRHCGVLAPGCEASTDDHARWCT